MRKSRRFGISIRKYCREHEAVVTARLESNDELDELLTFHGLKIRWMQHERLIHLIVTLIFTVLFLFSFGLCYTSANPLTLLLLAFVLVFLIAYIRHYFFLENTVQYWYTLYDNIYKQLKEKTDVM